MVRIAWVVQMSTAEILKHNVVAIVSTNLAVGPLFYPFGQVLNLCLEISYFPQIGPGSNNTSGASCKVQMASLAGA